MSIHIREFSVNSFRGIRDLKINDMNHINIIAGDNNSGKTSIMEAMLLLRDSSITNIIRVGRLRNTTGIWTRVSAYENFINLFPKEEKKLSICLDAIWGETTVQYHIEGEQKRVILESEDLFRGLSAYKRERMLRSVDSNSVEADAFTGKLKYDFGKVKDRVEININSHSPVSGMEIKKHSFFKMIYLSPFSHVQGSTFNQIIRNDAYKEICLHVLNIFDPSIVDLLILKTEDRGYPIEYIKHAQLGNMPLSSYGDGIKKVLSIANGIAQAVGGILLIDEVETAIHSRHYDDIFQFIVKACKQFDVQAFITTHSMEAIDGFLGTQCYDMQEQSDDINVITFKKEVGDTKTYSRVLAGRKVHANRNQFGFEVRL